MGLVFTLLVMCQMSYELDAQQCRYEYSTRGMMLKRHILMARKSANWLKCVDRCNYDIRCQSFNYVISQGVCELNNRTKKTRPEDFVPDSNRFYIKRLDGRGIVLLNLSVFLDQFEEVAMVSYTNMPRISLTLHSEDCQQGLQRSSRELNNSGVLI